MRTGDRVRAKTNHPALGVSRRHVGLLVSQSRKYKLSGGGYGQDAEVQFRHKKCTCIFQSDELKVVGGDE